MTSLRIVGLVALVLAIVPAAANAAQVEHSEDEQVDALHVRGNVNAGLLDGQSPDGEYARLDADYMASLVPSDSQMALILEFLLTLRPAPVESPNVAPVQDVEAEAEALVEEGVEAEGETHATNNEVSTSVQVSAGSQSHSAQAAARPADPVEAAPLSRSSWTGQGPAYSPNEEPKPEPAPDVAPKEALTISAAATSIEPIALPVALAATAVVLGTSASAAIMVVPGWRTAITRLIKRFGWLVLFSRIAQEDVLNHERRSELLEYIRHNPGERVEVARRALGFSNGSMHYHLRVLQDRQLVKILKEGSLARLYPRGPKITPTPYVPAQRKRFVDALSTAPGRTQRELAAVLGLSERMVSYHVRALAQQGLVEIRAEGARKRLFPAQTYAQTAVLAPAA